jgi:hypothetical protein
MRCKIIFAIDRGGGGGAGVVKHLDLDDGHKVLFTPDETHLTFLGNDFCINAIQGGIEQFLLYPNAKVFQAINEMF